MKTPAGQRPAGWRSRPAAVLATGLGVLAANARVLACPVCFQAQDGPGARGVLAGVFVLMAVTTAVLAAFAAFVVRFARRERGARTDVSRVPGA